MENNWLGAAEFTCCKLLSHDPRNIVCEEDATIVDLREVGIAFCPGHAYLIPQDADEYLSWSD